MENYTDRINNVFQSIKRTIQKNKLTQSLAILTSIYVSRKLYWFAYRKYYQLPSGPNGYPLLGIFVKMNKDRQFAITVGKTYGPITFAPLIGSIPCIILNSSKLVKQLLPQIVLLNRRVAFNVNPSGRPNILSVGKNVMPLVFINGEEWKRRRKHTQATLFRTMTNVFVTEIMYKSINNELKPFLDNIINTNSVWYPRKICEWIAFNTIYHTLFGKPISRDSELYHTMVNDVNNIFKLGLWDSVLDNIPFIKIFIPSILKRILSARNERNERIKQLIESRKISEYKSYLDYTSKLVEHGKMTLDEEIADTFILFAAGTETTSSTLDFGIVLIAKHINIQQMVRDEVLSVMKHKFNIKLVHQCPLFRALVHEILRISSVVFWGVFRCPDKDIKVKVDNKTYVISKNTAIRTNVDWIHLYNKDSENWKHIDQDKLFLENFLSDDKKRFILNPSFIPFGVGRRDCVGKQLALKEIQIILGYLLMNYKLTLDKPIDNILNYRKPTVATMFVDPPIGVKLQPV